MVAHKDLTGADLHESKGVASASINTVYVADGSGSGTWKTLEASSISGSSVLNINKQFVSFNFPDIGTLGSRYLAFTRACRIDKVTVVLQGATATTATNLTFRNDAGTSMGVLNIGNAATAGAVGTLVPVSNNTFTADTKLQVDTDGGTSTNVAVEITLEVTWT